MRSFTNEELLTRELAARLKAHGCPVYTGDQRNLATETGARSAGCGNEWFLFRSEVVRRDLTPLPLPEKAQPRLEEVS